MIIFTAQIIFCSKIDVAWKDVVFEILSGSFLVFQILCLPPQISADMMSLLKLFWDDILSYKVNDISQTTFNVRLIANVACFNSPVTPRLATFCIMSKVPHCDESDLNVASYSLVSVVVRGALYGDVVNRGITGRNFVRHVKYFGCLR